MEKEFISAMERYNPIIVKICFYYADRQEDFDDLRQDTLLNLWQGWNSFRGNADRSTWVYRVCLNTCVSAQKRKKSRPAPHSDFDSISRSLADSTADLSSLHNELHSLIQRLNAREKAVILLWLDEIPYDKIAEIMGDKRNNIASILRRAKEKLVKLSNQ